LLILPRFRKSPEQLVRDRLEAPALLSPKAAFSCDPALSPDGSLVAYASSDGGRTPLQIWLRPAAGGQPRRLTADPDRMEREPDFSPDGRTIAFSAAGREPGIYCTSIGGSAVRRLAAEGSRPRYSPGGRWIAFQARSGWLPGVGPASAIFVMPASGGPPRRVAAGFHHAQSPVWVNDSTLLFDGLSASGAADWYVTPVEGGEPASTGVTEILRPAVRLWGPPEGWWAGKAYFAASRGEDLDLWEIALGPGFHPAGPPRRITAGPERTGQIAVRAGGRIAFAKSLSTSNLFSVALDARTGRAAGPPRPLTTGEGGNRLPSVSASGRIAYLSNRSGMAAIWLAGPGGEVARVTGYQSVSYRPVLSADGRRVAFSTVEEGRCRVVAMEVKDQRRSYVTEGCMGIWDWSPDSKRLLIYPSTQLAAGHVEVLELDSNRRWPVLSHPTDRIFTPRFSPDGKWVAFTAGPAVDQARPFVAPFRGAAIPEEKWIAAGTLPGMAPAWSPDRERIYFRSARDGFDCLWAQPLGLPRTTTEEAFPVLHLHGPTPSLMRMGAFDFSLSVLADRLILGLAEHSGTVWTARLRD
jgi:Tol biopolymer transport system component